MEPVNNRHTDMFNLHTHRIPTDPAEEFMLNCNPGEVPADMAACSVGLHPWRVDEHWQELVEQVRADAAMPNVWAIGECGLDSLQGCDMKTQEAAFRAQIAVAEAVGKPMVIHCVRAFDQLLRIHKECQPRMPWIVHAFRGKPELAKQLMAKGMLLSFGHVFNVGTLRWMVTSGRSFYLETDCADLGLREICRRVQDALGQIPSLSPDAPGCQNPCADDCPASPLLTRMWAGRPTFPGDD